MDLGSDILLNLSRIRRGLSGQGSLHQTKSEQLANTQFDLVPLARCLHTTFIYGGKELVDDDISDPPFTICLGSDRAAVASKSWR